MSEPKVDFNSKSVPDVAYESPDINAPQAPVEPEGTTEESTYEGLAVSGLNENIPQTEAQTAEQNYIAPVKASKLASVGAGMGGMTREVFRRLETLRHDLDPMFDHQPHTDEFIATWGEADENILKYLAQSKNFNDWKTRRDQVIDEGYRKQAAADNPVSNMVGSLADVDVLLGGAYSRGKLAHRAVGGLVAATATAAAYQLGGGYDSTLRTEGEVIGDILTMGLTRALAPSLKTNAPTVHPTATPTQGQARIGSTQAAHDVYEHLRNWRPPQGTPAEQVKKNPIISALQSTADQLRYYTKGDNTTQVNKLLSNPVFNNGDDVVSAQNVYHNNYQSRLMGVEDSLKDAVTQYTGVRNTFANRLNGSYGRATKEVSEEFQHALQRLDSKVLEFHETYKRLPNDSEMDALIRNMGNHEAVDKVIKSYIDSGFAHRVYDDAYSSRLFEVDGTDAAGNPITTNGMDNMVRRPTYMPLRHNFDKIADTVRSGRATMDEVADLIGQQIARMYPELLNPKGKTGAFKLTKRQLGQHFLQTQKEGSRGLSQVSVTGMNKEQLIDLLSRTGSFTNKEAKKTAHDIFEAMHKQGTAVASNLRRRIEWDWEATLRTQSGHNLSMRDLVDNNVVANLEDYSRNMAHRIGLSDYGIKSDAQLHELLESYLDKLPEGADIQKARTFFKNIADTLLGRPIESNPVPEGIRIGQAVADLFLLANSGLYGLVELATQLQKVGVIRTLPAIRRGMATAFTPLSKFTQKEAKELEDILTGRMLSNSRFKNWFTRYADDFEVSSGLAETAQYYGQTARFMNLSESVKRFQAGVLASVYVSNLKKAMAGSAKDLKFMRKNLAIDEDLLHAIQIEYGRHGTNIDSWSNTVRIKYEQKLYHDADNLVMNVHNGEVPAILEHSAVGRVVFPYMRHVASMHNKILRRTYQRDGYTGIAMLMAVQIPAAMLVGAAINVRKGEEPDKDLTLMTIRSMSALGSLGYPLEIAMAGLSGGGVTALAPVGKTYNFGKELITGGENDEVDASKLLINSPLNSNIVLDYLVLALEDE